MFANNSAKTAAIDVIDLFDGDKYMGRKQNEYVSHKQDLPALKEV